MAPVGIRCPDHSGKAQGVQRVTKGVRRAAFEGTGAKVTKALIGINVAVYVAELATGGGVNGTGSTIYLKGVLFGPLLEQGEWWRLVTAAFLHYGPVHLILNMVGLYWFGSLLEERIGSGRYLMLYVVSGLAGSAGALLWPNGFLTPTVGASGAIFGILGAGLVLERQRDRGGLGRADDHQHAALVALALDHDPVLALRVAVDADHRDLLRPAHRGRGDLARIARARQDHAQPEHEDETAESAELHHGRPDLPGSVVRAVSTSPTGQVNRASRRRLRATAPRSPPAAACS